MSDNPYSTHQDAPGTPFSKPGVEAGLDYNAVAPICQAAGWLKFIFIILALVGGAVSSQM